MNWEGWAAQEGVAEIGYLLLTPISSWERSSHVSQPALQVGVAVWLCSSQKMGSKGRAGCSQD